MKKTSYTIKFGCDKKPKLVVGITTNENWVESQNKDHESFLFDAETGIVYAQK